MPHGGAAARLRLPGRDARGGRACRSRSSAASASTSSTTTDSSTTSCRRCAAPASTVFIVHARKAILQGLTPKENREIPPLRYETGGPPEAREPGPHGDPERRPARPSRRCASGGRSCDGVMLGRQAYQEPYLLAELHREFIDRAWTPPPREEVVVKVRRLRRAHARRGTPPAAHAAPAARPLCRVLRARGRGAASWRSRAIRPGAGAEVLRESLRMFRCAA